MTIELLARILFSMASVAVAVSSGLIRREVVTAYSSEDQAAIVKIHNEYRRAVYPTASNMMELKWDVDLSKKAQDLADKCVFENSNTDGIGQNLYFSTGKPDVTGPITYWHDEVKHYHYNEDNRCDKDKTCSNYKQVVWASTTAVGCGIKNCSTLKVPHSGEKAGWLVVCNYKPRGNVAGEWPYETGTKCSQCSGGKPCKNELCSDCSTQSDEGCKCKIECKHGRPKFGVKCECECEFAFSGERCEEICKVDYDRCHPYRKLSERWCTPDSDGIGVHCNFPTHGVKTESESKSDI